MLTSIAVLLYYFAHSRKDRAAMWRKVSCYCGARAVAIETFELKHNSYRREMGIE